MSNESSASQWLSSNLAAIGSAAVLTVYAAGYARTKPAADLLAAESERRPNARPTSATSSGQVGPEVARQPIAIEAAAATPTTVAAAPQPPTAASKVNEPTVGSAPAPTTAAPTPATSAPAPTTSAASASAPSQTSAPASVQPSASTVPAPSGPSAPSAAPTQAASAPAPAPAPAAAPTADTSSRAGLKDGMYSGWGTSRHGDIQAYVEIKGGKITSAFISECLTQYSCSWIAKLPPQVVERQSAEIDYVSGATVSSNALYYAVADALKKAK